MQVPETIRWLYIDFDGFFASVMQQVMPRLRGKPVGVIPFDTKQVNSTSIIACSREAKAMGVKNVMHVSEALAICPDLQLVAQRPDLYSRANIALLREIESEIPVDTVKSIDECVCRLDRSGIAAPEALAARIKGKIRENIGPYITCSIGMATSRLLAKIACESNKPDGLTIWHPQDMPAPLLALPLDSIPGVGRRMEARLQEFGITSMAQLYATQPREMRALWHSVLGERMWYALHGFDVKAPPTSRSMYGHSRVLPPDFRAPDKAKGVSRLLLVKAARRMRKGGHCAQFVALGVRLVEGGRWGAERPTWQALDNPALLAALEDMWTELHAEMGRGLRIKSFSVTLHSLVPIRDRQMDLLATDPTRRHKAETLTELADSLNLRFNKRILSFGPWTMPPGGYAGGKIAFTHRPTAEDFI